MALPVESSYAIARIAADCCYLLKGSDRIALTKNIRMVVRDSLTDDQLQRIVRESFRNFAKYLVDFFRSKKIDKEYIDKNIKIEGAENIEDAKSDNKGVIFLSAHIGNWELGGAVLSLTGYPVNAVVLTHKNKRINDFFTRQRLNGKMVPIEIGASLRSCYNTLKGNGFLALLGDRDFTKNGIWIDFFGHQAMMPKGPAALSYRMGSVVVPAFMVRDDHDKFKLIIGKPIRPERIRKKGPGANRAGKDDDEELAIRCFAKKYIAVLEEYIRKYPSQWYAFREIWRDGDKDLRPDTII